MIQEELHIGLLQWDTYWLQVERNLESIEMWNLPEKLDVLILPEMFATGFCMQPELVAETPEGKIVQWMRNFSLEKNIAVCGSVAIQDENKYYNRFYFFYKGELIGEYNKRHLFSYSGEDKVYTAGNEVKIFNFLGWRISPQICYDLRFPVWFRNTSEYDILLNVANWPDTRIAIWDYLIQARSIENMCYVVGCNRMGKDGNSLVYNGHSTVCFPSAEKYPISPLKTLIISTLSYEKLKTYKEKFPFLNDKDAFILKP